MSQQGYIQLTRECNQDCRFCSNPSNENRIELEKAKELVDGFVEQGFSGVIFTGGEPTLSPALPEVIGYAVSRGMPCRIITNGQRICDEGYFRELYDAGLRGLNISIYSVREDVQAFLSGNKDSFANVKRALANAGRFKDVQVVVNTVINKFNADHLSENIDWVVENAPFVRHFVWNNLDPRNSKVERFPDTVARLNDFQLELHRAVGKVLGGGRTCRVERVPLCYMAEFEHLSTETRKIVKGERTSTYFLDEKGLFSSDTYSYGKAECCGFCTLEGICAGLFEMDVYYFSDELYACFVDREKVVKRIVEPEADGALKPAAGRKKR